MSRNRLADETSPYLLQHQDNPVHWYPWGPEALARSRADNKPILLSVGYSSCHWCHVMAHESFENPDIAALMNDLFVNIKVDREERPDLDALYQAALALMGEQGGWPLTLFLDSDGVPFWGGTYFPPTARFGRPGFADLLTVVAQAWREQTDQISRSTQDIARALGGLSTPRGGTSITPESFERAAALALRAVDTRRGGTAGAPKFPQPTFFRFLWHAARRLGTDLYADPVITTLTRMCQGGIYDHLGGGFARYSTDEEWLVPHFEKMLYDNALVIELLTEVWKETRDPLFAVRVEETVEWLLRDMRVTPPDADGSFAFAGALDADSEGQEGRYYVWSEDEIDALLGSDSPVFKESYDVTRPGNWEGRTILNRSRGRSFGMPALEARLAENRETLRAAREHRVPPLRDDKVLTDWNAMAVSALARAGAVFRRPDWLEAASAVWSFLSRRLRDEHSRLHHTWQGGSARHRALADDYAQLARAAVILHEVTGETAYLDAALALIAEADRHHLDTSDGGYFFSADDADDVFVRAKVATDTATPAANATLAEVFARLFHLTGDAAWYDRARALVTLFGPADPAGLLHAPSLLIAHDLLEGGVLVTVAGAVDDPMAEALFRVALETAPPAAVLARDLAADTPSATLCLAGACSLPTADPQILRRDLSALRGDRFGPAPDSASQRARTG